MELNMGLGVSVAVVVLAAVIATFINDYLPSGEYVGDENLEPL